MFYCYQILCFSMSNYLNAYHIFFILSVALWNVFSPQEIPFYDWIPWFRPRFLHRGNHWSLKRHVNQKISRWELFKWKMLDVITVGYMREPAESPQVSRAPVICTPRLGRRHHSHTSTQRLQKNQSLEHCSLNTHMHLLYLTLQALWIERFKAGLRCHAFKLTVTWLHEEQTDQSNSKDKYKVGKCANSNS